MNLTCKIPTVAYNLLRRYRFVKTLGLQLDFLEQNVMQGKKRIVEAWISDPDVWKGAGPQSRKELYSK